MAGNYLEQLVSEWYEYRGYFVRRNVLVGKRENGGHDCELDVVAFRPETKHLVHIEPSMDAHTWEVREARFTKKFDAGKKHIPSLFKGVVIPDDIEQIALLAFASKKSRETIGGGRIMLIPELLAEVFLRIRTTSLSSSAIPEQFALLRTLQLVSDNRNYLSTVLSE